MRVQHFWVPRLFRQCFSQEGNGSGHGAGVGKEASGSRGRFKSLPATLTSESKSFSGLLDSPLIGIALTYPDVMMRSFLKILVVSYTDRELYPRVVYENLYEQNSFDVAGDGRRSCDTS